MDQLRSLRVFTQVIAEGSFAGAARVLDLAPAVVARALIDFLVQTYGGTRAD